MGDENAAFLGVISKLIHSIDKFSIFLLTINLPKVDIKKIEGLYQISKTCCDTNRLKITVISNQFSLVLYNNMKSAKRLLLCQLILGHASGPVRLSNSSSFAQTFFRKSYMIG